MQQSSLNNCKLIITPEVEKIIRTCCILCPRREWSGVLFYTFEGDFESGVTLTTKDILLLDVGSAAHTYYDLDSPETTSYMFKNGLAGCCIGHIHSHNEMAAFFSGEDDSTLEDLGKKMNNFLSLIVNNAGNYVARVTRKYSIDEVRNTTVNGKKVYKLFNTGVEKGEEYTKHNTQNFSSVEVDYVNLIIEKPVVNVNNPIIERYIDLTKEERKPVFGGLNPFNSVATLYPWEDNNYEEHTLFPEFEKEKQLSERKSTKSSNTNEEKKDEKLTFSHWFEILLSGSRIAATHFTSLASLLYSYSRIYDDITEFEDWFTCTVEFLLYNEYYDSDLTEWIQKAINILKAEKGDIANTMVNVLSKYCE